VLDVQHTDSGLGFGEESIDDHNSVGRRDGRRAHLCVFCSLEVFLDCCEPCTLIRRDALPITRCSSGGELRNERESGLGGEAERGQVEQSNTRELGLWNYSFALHDHQCDAGLRCFETRLRVSQRLRLSLSPFTSLFRPLPLSSRSRSHFQPSSGCSLLPPSDDSLHPPPNNLQLQQHVAAPIRLSLQPASSLALPAAEQRQQHER
jgi:hypothetical protein